MGERGGRKIDLGVISIEMLFEAVRFNFTQGVCVDGEEKRYKHGTLRDINRKRERLEEE